MLHNSYADGVAESHEGDAAMAQRSPNWEYSIEFPIPVKCVRVQFPNVQRQIPQRSYLGLFEAVDSNGSPLPAKSLAGNYSKTLGRHFQYVDTSARIPRTPDITLPSHSIAKLIVQIVPWTPEAQTLAPGQLGCALISGKTTAPPRVWTLATEGNAK